MFCFKANENSCRKIKETIDTFCGISGELAINFEKSNVIISPNTPLGVKEELKKILGTPCTNKLRRYLGCDVEIDWRTSQDFLPLVDKV